MFDDERDRKTVRRPMDISSKGDTVFTGKCDVRLSKQDDLALTKLAERNGVSRSDVMRRALRDFIVFNSEEE